MRTTTRCPRCRNCRAAAPTGRPAQRSHRDRPKRRRAATNETSLSLRAGRRFGCQPSQDGTHGKIHRAHHERTCEQPGGERMHAGPTEVVQESTPIRLTKHPQHFAHGETSVRRAPHSLPQTHVGHYHHQLHGPEYLVERLQQGVVQAQPPSHTQIEQRGEPQKRKQRARRANGKRQRHAVRGNTLREKREQRCTDSLLPERAVLLHASAYTTTPTTARKQGRMIFPGWRRVNTVSSGPSAGTAASCTSMYADMAKFPRRMMATNHSTRAAIDCSFHATQTKNVTKAQYASSNVAITQGSRKVALCAKALRDCCDPAQLVTTSMETMTKLNKMRRKVIMG